MIQTDSIFIGRKKELAALNDLLAKKIASLVVIKGRRRIGKSRLIQEFAKNKKFFIFSGIPPLQQTTAQSQRNEFTKQLSAQTSCPEVQVDDWNKNFLLLNKEVQSQKSSIIVLLDEISWMGSKDPDFLGKLKNAWDNYFKKNPKLILILCGSVSSWIQKNIINSTGFFGRIALKCTLEELSLPESNALIESIGFKRSSFEKFMLLAITGGIPWYIELINPAYSANENIQKLCFEKDGILVDEFKFIFQDLFKRRANICKKIVTNLAKGPLERSKLITLLKYPKSGSLNEYLEDLLTSGFISQDHIWSIKSGLSITLNRFRLKDNYLRFYLKYIATNLDKINKNQFSNTITSSLPNWNSIIGFQFENLILNNRHLVYQQLGIKPEEIVYDNPYFQRNNSKQQGCQIDYLIQTRHNTLFVCEIKFSKTEIPFTIVNELKTKISKLVLPKGFACLPILININGVNESVHEANYFFKIINFSDLLYLT